MMDTHKLAKFSSTGIFAQARQIVAAATILLALTLAGPPRLWGQCGDHNSNSVAASVAVSPGSVVGNSGRTMTATITVAPVRKHFGKILAQSFQAAKLLRVKLERSAMHDGRFPLG